MSRRAEIKHSFLHPKDKSCSARSRCLCAGQEQDWHARGRSAVALPPFAMKKAGPIVAAPTEIEGGEECDRRKIAGGAESRTKGGRQSRPESQRYARRSRNAIRRMLGRGECHALTRASTLARMASPPHLGAFLLVSAQTPVADRVHEKRRVLAACFCLAEQRLSFGENFA